MVAQYGAKQHSQHSPGASHRSASHLAEYVSKLPESRRGEILSGNFTREQIQNCVPDRVLQALDAEGNYRHRTGNLRDQASRAAILRQNILHQQKR